MNKIYLYNTLSRKKEEFKPIHSGQVLFYHCGPTVYWTQHIGNLRGMTMADFIVRTFRYLDYKVSYVRNYTDVGHLSGDNEGDADSGVDRMEKGARRDGVSPQEIAQKYIDIFENDIKELNLEEPTAKPRATEYIEEMIKIVQELLDKGYAYSTDLAIYFDISKARDYTALSGQNLEECLSGAGRGEVSDPNKKNAGDFVVWFFRTGKHAKALQFWPSPFTSSLVEAGNGFPGWHLECSAMSRKLLGKRLDIHMGGVEHISIHHTNEIAQSEAVNNEKYANYWLHNEHLLVDDKKMSKSEGTGYSLAEIKEKGFLPLVLRFFFAQANYRSKQNFTWEAMQSAENGLKHLHNQVRILGDKKGKIDKKFKDDFIKVISDDFNIAQGIAITQEMLKSEINNEEKLATVLDFDRVLGLGLDKINKEELKIEVKELIKAREQARVEKNFAESDQLREKIENLGYTVEDSIDGMRVFKS